MLLKLTALQNSQQIEVEIADKRMIAGNSEELLIALDKLFAVDKLGVNTLEVVYECQKNSSHTSCRSVKTVHSAWQVAKKFL